MTGLVQQADRPVIGAALNSGPRFGFVNVLYYFGGMVAIGAMSLFMTLGFQAMGVKGLLLIGLAYALGALKVADHFKAKAWPFPLVCWQLWRWCWCHSFCGACRVWRALGPRGVAATFRTTTT